MARPRRVLHLISGVAGGSATSAVELMEELSGRGVSCAVVSGESGPGQLSERIEAVTGGAVLRVPLYWWPRRIRAAAWKRPLIDGLDLLRTGCVFGSARRIAAFAREQRIDLVHTSSMAHVEGGMVARSLGLPHVWHVRELIGPDRPFRLPLSGAPLRKFLKAHGSVFIANSRVTRSGLSELVDPERLKLVHNGIPTCLLEALPARRGSAPVVVAMIGSLSSRSKRQDLFVRAAARLPREANVRFELYGDDPGDAYSERIHAQVKAGGLEKRFVFSGFCPDPRRIIESVDVLVQPSEQESFGRVTVEAMAGGRPVVAPSVGAASEIVTQGQTGILVPPGDDESFGRAIATLVEDEPLRLRLGGAGRVRARAHFSVESCTDGVLEAYSEAMARPLGRRSPG